MGSVTIAGSSFEVFGTLQGARTYLSASLSGAPFASALATVQAQALVSSTRMILRVGLVDPADGSPILPTTDPLPLPVEQGAYELALALLVDPQILTTPGSGSNVKRRRIEADVVKSEVEFFGATFLLFGRFPTIVQELLGPYLAGRTVIGPQVTGADFESQFARGDFGFDGEGLP